MDAADQQTQQLDTGVPSVFCPTLIPYILLNSPLIVGFQWIVDETRLAVSSPQKKKKRNHAQSSSTGSRSMSESSPTHEQQPAHWQGSREMKINKNIDMNFGLNTASASVTNNSSFRTAYKNSRSVMKFETRFEDTFTNADFSSFDRPSRGSRAAAVVAPPTFKFTQDIRLSPSPSYMEFDTFTNDDYFPCTDDDFSRPSHAVADFANFTFDLFDRPSHASVVVVPPTFTQSQIASGSGTHPMSADYLPAGAAMSPPMFDDMNLLFTSSPGVAKVVEDQYMPSPPVFGDSMNLSLTPSPASVGKVVEDQYMPSPPVFGDSMILSFTPSPASVAKGLEDQYMQSPPVFGSRDILFAPSPDVGKVVEDHYYMPSTPVFGDMNSSGRGWW